MHYTGTIWRPPYLFENYIVECLENGGIEEVCECKDQD